MPSKNEHYIGRHWDTTEIKYAAQHRNGGHYIRLSTTQRRVLLTALLLAGTISATSASMASTPAQRHVTPQPSPLSTATVPAPTEVAVTEEGPTSNVPIEAPVPTAIPQQLSKRQAITNYATAHVGTHYAIGATGPVAFDEIGLVLAAYSEAGVVIPGKQTPAGILDSGTAVKPNDASMMLGDIVFPTKTTVGIYVGNGKMVIANPTAGVVLIVVPTVYAVRRMSEE